MRISNFVYTESKAPVQYPPGSSWINLDPPGSTWILLDPPGSTWINLDQPKK